MRRPLPKTDRPGPAGRVFAGQTLIPRRAIIAFNRPHKGSGNEKAGIRWPGG